MKGSIKCPWCEKVLERESHPERAKHAPKHFIKRLGTMRLMEDFIKHIKENHENIVVWEETDEKR